MNVVTFWVNIAIDVNAILNSYNELVIALYWKRYSATASSHIELSVIIKTMYHNAISNSFSN